MYDGSHAYGKDTLKGIFARLLRGLPTGRRRHTRHGREASVLPAPILPGDAALLRLAQQGDFASSGGQDAANFATAGPTATKSLHTAHFFRHR
jgi:hypothetical protein